MPEIMTYGLKSIKSAAPSADGTMPAALTELCRTYRDSCDFTEEEPQLTEEFSDQDDDPVFTASVKGAKTIKFSTFDYSPELLTKLKGGTVVDDVWSEPTVTPEIYQAIELETNTGLKFQFPKARVIARFNSQFRKNGLSLLEVTLRPVSPATGKPSVLIEKPTP